MNSVREAALAALAQMKCGVATGETTIAEWYQAMANLEAALAEPDPLTLAGWVTGTTMDGTPTHASLIGSYPQCPTDTPLYTYRGSSQNRKGKEMKLDLNKLEEQAEQANPEYYVTFVTKDELLELIRLARMVEEQ